MPTKTEQQVAKTLGISAEAFAHSKGARSGGWRVALNTRETRGLIDSTYVRIAKMARSVGAQPATLLSHVVDRALRELDETGSDDGNGDDDRPARGYDAEVAHMLGVPEQELARTKAQRKGRVALQQREGANASTRSLLLNLSERELARVARSQHGDGDAFIPIKDSGADEVGAEDFLSSIGDVLADFERL